MQEKSVWSCNEWDPLEDVIVGIVDGAVVPSWTDPAVRATTPSHADWFFKKYGGQLFPAEMIEAASKELDGLAALLTSLGVNVRRPNEQDFLFESTTKWWKSKGLYAAMPRDVFFSSW